METLIGMALVALTLGGVTMSIVGVVTVAVTLPDAVRTAIVLRAKPKRIADVGDGAAVVQGIVMLADERPFPAYGDGGDLVFRKLTVFEQVGKHAPERASATESCRFAVDDGSGALTVDASGGKVLSPLVFGGPVTGEVLDRVGDVFAWPNTPKFYFEEALRPGDFVTVHGDVESGRIGGAVRILRGEPKLLASEPIRALLWAVASIPGGLALAGAFGLATQWWIG